MTASDASRRFTSQQHISHRAVRTTCVSVEHNGLSLVKMSYSMTNEVSHNTLQTHIGMEEIKKTGPEIVHKEKAPGKVLTKKREMAKVDAVGKSTKENTSQPSPINMVSHFA